jgi:hypothetical protein
LRKAALQALAFQVSVRGKLKPNPVDPVNPVGRIGFGFLL